MKLEKVVDTMKVYPQRRGGRVVVAPLLRSMRFIPYRGFESLSATRWDIVKMSLKFYRCLCQSRSLFVKHGRLAVVEAFFNLSELTVGFVVQSSCKKFKVNMDTTITLENGHKIWIKQIGDGPGLLVYPYCGPVRGMIILNHLPNR